MAVIAIIGGLLIAAIVIYGFRQGLKVTPDDRPDRSRQTNYGGGDVEVDRVTVLFFVVAGLDPAIHPVSKPFSVDGCSGLLREDARFAL
jgi:hypothetical protein